MLPLALVWQSRLAELPAPIDGFGGRLCIHLRQLAPVHEAFTPGAAKRAWAARVLAALETAGGAAVAVQGRRVDLPVWLQAQRIANASPDGSPARGQAS